jgi:hypothetical protein
MTATHCSLAIIVHPLLITVSHCRSMIRESEVKVMVRPTVSRPVCLVIKSNMEFNTWFVLLSDSWGSVDMGHPRWREKRTVISNCCRSWSAQSTSGTSPVGLITIFYRFRFEISPALRVKSLIYISRIRMAKLHPQWLNSFPPLPTTGRAASEVFQPVYKLKSKSLYNWRSVTESVCQRIEPTLGLVSRYYFLSEGCFLKVAVL